MRLRGDELRCLGGNAGDINDNDLAPIRVGGARDSPVFFKVDGRPVKSVGRGDWPALRPRMGKVSREGDKVGGDEGTRDPCLPNSTPSHVIAMTNGDSGEGGMAGRGGRGQNRNGDKEKTDSFEKRGMRLIAKWGKPGRTRMRGLADAASRVRTVVAGINDDGNSMDDEDPCVLSSATTAALGEPSGMDPRILVDLTRCRGEGSVKSIEGVEDPNTDVETMGVTNCLNVISDRLVIPDSKPVSGP